MANFFDGPKLKIERAKQHVCNLHNRILDFQESNFYDIVINKTSQTGEDVFRYEETETFPRDTALVVGDALHNLKGALDIAINEIIFSRLRRYDDHSRFPFRETRDELVTAIKGGLIHQASKAVADFIVDSVKPYNGGNDALWALHKLNIIDKHRLLLPVMNVSVLRNLRFENDRGQEITVDLWVFTAPQTCITPFPGHRNIKVTNKGEPSLLVLFDQGLPLQDKPVLPSLKQLTHVVSSVIQDMEAVFLSGG